MINFCYDRLATPTVGYPNLAKWSAEPYTQEWREFDQHWPRTIPLRLLMYLDSVHIPYGVHTVEDAPVGSWYPVAFSWFDFSCDYFSLMSPTLKARLHKGEIKVLFYYHEGDNPDRINQQLHLHRFAASLPGDCHYLVSANTAADLFPNVSYFSDHEFFFRHVNRKQRPLPHTDIKPYEFTALNRTHKWWRASIMSDLKDMGILNNSMWSYHTDCTIDDDPQDNPIELGIRPNWENSVKQFVANGPYCCDELNLQKQNDHHYVNTALYTESYFQIVIETHFDADQSGGTFITEKTWKPVKFGQPFVVIGPAGTLAALRAAGYRVFDSVLDNSYDTIENNTQRYLSIQRLLSSIKHHGISKIYQQCLDDAKHNQMLFETRVHEPLNILLEKLQCQI